MSIQRVIEYANLHRLVVKLSDDGSGYTWKVSHLEDGVHWLLGGSACPMPFDHALARGREELAVWSEDEVTA